MSSELSLVLLPWSHSCFLPRPLSCAQHPMVLMSHKNPEQRSPYPDPTISALHPLLSTYYLGIFSSENQTQPVLNFPSGADSTERIGFLGKVPQEKPQQSLNGEDRPPPTSLCPRSLPRLLSDQSLSFKNRSLTRKRVALERKLRAWRV